MCKTEILIFNFYSNWTFYLKYINIIWINDTKIKKLSIVGVHLTVDSPLLTSIQSLISRQRLKRSDCHIERSVPGYRRRRHEPRSVEVTPIEG